MREKEESNAEGRGRKFYTKFNETQDYSDLPLNYYVQITRADDQVTGRDYANFSLNLFLEV